MDFLNVKGLTIPEGEVTKLAIGGVVIWEKAASIKNWARFATEADDVTIYNGGR